MRRQEKDRSYKAKILENFRIDRFDSDRLRTAAAVAGKPNGTLIREILIRWLDQQEIDSDQPRKRPNSNRLDRPVKNQDLQTVA